MDIVPRVCVCLWILFQGCVRVCLCVCICASVRAHVCRHGGQRSTSDVFLFVPDLLTLFSETASCIARGAHSLGDCPASEAPPTYLSPSSEHRVADAHSGAWLFIRGCCMSKFRFSCCSIKRFIYRGFSSPAPSFQLVCLFVLISYHECILKQCHSFPLLGARTGKRPRKDRRLPS